jgi:PAS domain S-box-containing protein
MTGEKPYSSEEAAGFFERLKEFNAVPIITSTVDGGITSCNDAFLAMIGYSREDFTQGRINWRELTRRPEMLELDARCIREPATQQIATPYEKEYVRKDGGIVRIRLYNGINHPGDVQRVAIIMPIG